MAHNHLASYDAQTSTSTPTNTPNAVNFVGSHLKIKETFNSEVKDEKISGAKPFQKRQKLIQV